MALEWYYTTNKQQMGPVTWSELRELAGVGILKPHDQVWSEGMAEWVKAINQQGLFADGEEGASSSAKKASYKAPKPPPGRRIGRRQDEEDDDEDDEEDSKESKRKARKKQEERAKMAVGLKVALILGGVVAVLLLLGCVGVGLIWMAWPNWAGRTENYTVINLGEKQSNQRTFKFTQGKRVVITCTNSLQFNNTDVDLYVFRGNNPVVNEQPFRSDIRLPQESLHCRVEFDVPANDTYRIRVVNIGPGMAHSCVVNIEEF